MEASAGRFQTKRARGDKEKRVSKFRKGKKGEKLPQDVLKSISSTGGCPVSVPYRGTIESAHLKPGAELRAVISEIPSVKKN